VSGVNVGLPTVKLRRSPHGLRCFVSVSSSRPIGGGRCSLPMLAARPRWCAAAQENRSVRFRERRLDVSARSARKLCGAKRCSEQCAFARESEVGFSGCYGPSRGAPRICAWRAPGRPFTGQSRTPRIYTYDGASACQGCGPGWPVSQRIALALAVVASVSAVLKRSQRMCVSGTGCAPGAVRQRCEHDCLVVCVC